MNIYKHPQKRQRKLLRFTICFLLILIIVACSNPNIKNQQQWGITGGSKKNVRYSALNQIDTSNVKNLQVAWVYQSEKGDSTNFGPMECNPIIIRDTLYGVSPKLKLFAINASTGKEIWKFNPADSIVNSTWHRKSVNMNRGVAYWEKEKDKRIIYTVGPIVLSVNANTGKLISSFGTNGGITLVEGLDRDPKKLFVAPTSPVMTYKDLFFVSGLVGEETPGHIRGFDVVTGEQKWIFHTIPYPDEKGYDTWEDKEAYKYMGSTNSWAGFSLDEERGILYAPIGNPTNDFYGGNRKGDGLFGNSLVALNANTGELIWHYQVVHHDVWDMDIPAPPSLVTIQANGKMVDAVVQTTKMGIIYVLDRETGKPLFPIEERSVPTIGKVVGEALSPTQPFPTLPKPFVRHNLTRNDLNNVLGDSVNQSLKKRFDALNYQGIYTPPSEKGTIVFPGYDGGGEWGGPAVDPETNILYVNASEMAWELKLIKRKVEKQQITTKSQAGKIVYNKYCMGCHGQDRTGAGDYPSIVGVQDKYTTTQFTELISTGRRMMPGFPQITDDEKSVLANYILNLESDEERIYKEDLKEEVSNESEIKHQYGFNGYKKFLTDDGYPAISPPWGTLSAINLNDGQLLWKIPFGEFEELKKKGIPTTGRENYGGPVVTAGGLIFIAATADGKFRVLNKRNGDILFETDLPAPGIATPSTYEVDGIQYVVIACGGSKWGGKSTDKYVAFALPIEKME